MTEFLSEEPFFDRAKSDTNSKVSDSFDVVMPILNTNIFFRRNLLSLFREIPVNQLLVGDAGSTDESADVLAEFPRVKVFDHKLLKSLGGSIKQLIQSVETKNFIYLHSDVYLPVGFFDEMDGEAVENKWLESNRKSLIIHEDNTDEYYEAERPYSGFQLGESALLKRALLQVEDDYLYRNEDLVIRELVEEAGGEYKKLRDLRHLHQSITKNTEHEPALRVQVSREPDFDWEVRTANDQYRGIVKYTNPSGRQEVSYLVDHVNQSLAVLHRLGALRWNETVRWVKRVNPDWIPYLQKPQ